MNEQQTKPRKRSQANVRLRGRPTRRDLEGAEEKALELRLKGWTLKAISIELLCSEPHALTLYNRAIANRRPILDKKYTQWVDEQIMQIEEVYSVHAESVEDPRCAEIMLRCMDRKAKLLGLDRPTKVEMVPPAPEVEFDVNIELLPLEDLKEFRRLVSKAKDLTVRHQHAIDVQSSVVEVKQLEHQGRE